MGRFRESAGAERRAQCGSCEHSVASLLRHIVCAVMMLAGATGHAQEWVYTARPGDNLWDLTTLYLKHLSYWPRLQQLNGIADPRRIPVGTRIRMPIAWLKQQPASAHVVLVQGQVQRSSISDPSFRPLAVGDELRSGDHIRTGPQGTVTVELADGSRMAVRGDSEVILDTMSAYGSTGMVDSRMRLRGGRLENRVTPSVGPGSRFQIITPAAVAAVRGTDFRFNAERGGRVSRTEVLGGAVGVAGGGAARTVPAGFGTVAEQGRPVARPRPLLEPPDVSQVARRVQRLPVSFHWPPVAGARGYRVQVFADGGFERLLHDLAVATPAATLPNLPDGDYGLRLRAVDEVGLEGRNAELTYTLDARPFPPLVLGPTQDAVVYQPRPELRWAVTPGASSFHVELASDDQFRHVLSAAPELTGQQLRPEQALAPGRYYWRVATRDGSDEGPFSEPQRFEVRSAPASPQVAPPAVEIGDLHFQWSPVADAQRYQFQLDFAPEFADPLENRVVAQPQVTIARPWLGLYYYRVRALTQDGTPGSYSLPQTLWVRPTTYWPALLLVPLALVPLL